MIKMFNHGPIPLLMDQYVHYIISPCDIDTLAALIISYGRAKLVSLPKTEARFIYQQCLVYYFKVHALFTHSAYV